jgi:hypothetical protein
LWCLLLRFRCRFSHVSAYSNSDALLTSQISGPSTATTCGNNWRCNLFLYQVAGDAHSGNWYSVWATLHRAESR